MSATPFKILSGSGDQKLLALTGLLAAGVNITLTAVLGYFFGITGVALARLGTNVVVMFGVTLTLVGRRLGIGVMQLLRPTLRAHVAPIVVAGALGIYLSKGPLWNLVRSHGRLTNTVSVGVAGVIVLVVYAAVYSITGLDRADRRAVMARVPLLGRRVRRAIRDEALSKGQDDAAQEASKHPTAQA
jgi:O-antigen/teichoic acid export membrane protein